MLKDSLSEKKSGVVGVEMYMLCFKTREGRSMSQVILPPNVQTPGVFFVGREEEQHKYKELLMGDPPWMMFITGIAGTGKTTLLNRLAQQTPSNVPVIRFRFDNESLLIDT